MRVELLYFDGCPNWQVVDERLVQALGELGRADVVVERRKVETPEQAEDLKFVGSPTILIDGADPFASGTERVAGGRATAGGALVKKLLLVLLSGYVLVAAGNRVAEHFGMRSCGCADDCWCHRPGVSLFRWVFPWGHTPAHPLDEKADLDASSP